MPSVGESSLGCIEDPAARLLCGTGHLRHRTHQACRRHSRFSDPVTTVAYGPVVPLTARRDRAPSPRAGTGRWVSVVGDRDVLGHGRVRFEVGSTGNRLDPTRRVRRTGHDLVRADGRLELRSWWPVQEVRTPDVGQFSADLGASWRPPAAPTPTPIWPTSICHRPRPAGRPVEPGRRRPGGPHLAIGVSPAARPIELGARPVTYRWRSRRLLRHADVRTATQKTLRPRSTRPLVRAVATSLLPDGEGRIVWEPLQCALMAAMRCGPEQLVSDPDLAAAPPGRGVVLRGRDRPGPSDVRRSSQPRRVAETSSRRVDRTGRHDPSRHHASPSGTPGPRHRPRLPPPRRRPRHERAVAPRPGRPGRRPHRLPAGVGARPERRGRRPRRGPAPDRRTSS